MLKNIGIQKKKKLALSIKSADRYFTHLEILHRDRSNKNEIKTHLLGAVNSFFYDISLCGPRVITAPGTNNERKLCELFIPYHHSMRRMYNSIETLFGNVVIHSRIFDQTIPIFEI